MKRGRWSIALQFLLWCLLAPPFVLVVGGHPDLPRFTYIVLLTAFAIVLYFFNFKSSENIYETAGWIFIYLLLMAVSIVIAGYAYFWAMVYVGVIKGM
jgi:hypothetical protein